MEVATIILSYSNVVNNNVLEINMSFVDDFSNDKISIV